MSDQKINLQYTTFTTPLPDFIYEGLRDFSKNANGYKPQPAILLEKLAQKFGIAKETIFLTAGADEAIQLFTLTYGQEKKIAIFTPTYAVYHDMKDFGGNISQVNILQDNVYVLPTATIPDAALIYLANPNNPFGFTSREKVLELAKNNPQAIVVVDEVYAEFADLSVINEVATYPNLAVLRSFSKSYGMAGNRIGFIVAHPDILAKIKGKVQWANVSYLSVGAAVIALAHEEYFADLRNTVIATRTDFEQFLQSRNFSLLPSKINAVLLHFSSEEQGTTFANYLIKNNFVISHGNGNSNCGLDKSFVRISIGTKEEMEKVKRIIEKFTT